MGPYKRRVTNAEIAGALREMALFLEMEEVPFKPRAYERAAYAVEALDRPIAAIDADGGIRALSKIPGVGKGVAGRIQALVRTGRLPELESRRAAMPVDLVGLTSIGGIGPKRARALFRELGVRTIEDLRRAALAGRVRKVPKFGDRSEQAILEAIEFHRQTGGRRLLGAILELAANLESRLRAQPEVVDAAVAGSIRRRRETIGDVDVLIATADGAGVSRFFASMPEVDHVYAEGPTKTLVRLANGLDADLRLVPEACFGAALLYFTGSKDHNIALRKIALAKGYKLSEYGLFRGQRRIAGRTEEEVYRALDLPWIPPEIREDQGEIEAAIGGRLPDLVGYGDLRGDLQVQSRWSDGASTIEELAREAKRLGRAYVAVTDHTRDLAMARGLDEARLREQRGAIRRAQQEVSGIRILAGAEVNIRRDGSLDVSDDALAELDVVGASIHSEFRLPRPEMTRRIVRAIENPNVDILFHPTARAIGSRAAVEFDLDAVLETARRTGTALEVNAQPNRLDLSDELVRRAVRAGVRLVIDSDAHTPYEMRFPEQFGVAQARRGWAERKDVLNTRDVHAFLASLKPKARGPNRPA